MFLGYVHFCLCSERLFLLIADSSMGLGGVWGAVASSGGEFLCRAWIFWAPECVALRAFKEVLNPCQTGLNGSQTEMGTLL